MDPPVEVFRAVAHPAPDREEAVKDISSRAEVALEYPGKTTIGIFERHSRHVGLDEKGVIIKLEHSGEERKVVDVHPAYALFRDMPHDLAALKGDLTRIAETERRHFVDALNDAAQALGRDHHDAKERQK